MTLEGDANDYVGKVSYHHGDRLHTWLNIEDIAVNTCGLF